MSIDWTKPLVVAWTDRVATVESPVGRGGAWVRADWKGDGEEIFRWINNAGNSEFGPTKSIANAVTNAPPTPKISPEHIEALAWAIEEADEAIGDEQWHIDFYAERDPNNKHMQKAYAVRKLAAEQRAARLAEIRVYLESL